MNKRTDNRPSLSIIIPTLNEAQAIGKTLAALSSWTSGSIETIVADGGSSDSTTIIAQQFGARVVTSEKGRGSQMHCGARNALGENLLFLHADTTCPPEAKEWIDAVLSADASVSGGNFDLRFDGQTRAARFMTWLYPRLGKLGLYYGDSGIFVRASVYDQVGGFRPLPLFEDLDFVRRLRRAGKMVHIPVPLVTSSRRFEGRSFALTFAQWSIMQSLYWLGVPPRVLNQLYLPLRTSDRKKANLTRRSKHDGILQ